MKDFRQEAARLSPAVYQQFIQAIATGKWPDGRTLAEEQREIITEAIILYEHANLPPEQYTGHIPDRCRSAAGDADVQKLELE